MRRSDGTRAARSGPGARFGHGLAHDGRSGLTILFGGFDGDGAPRSDTWGCDGASWRLLAGEGPEARKWPAMAYDERRGEVVLFGGLGGVGRTQPPFGDTWSWAGSGWRQVDSPGPGPRDHVRMSWDAAPGRLILFGGFDGREAVGDTWAWNGEVWSRLDAKGPSPRAAHAMASDAEGGILLFGGRSLDRFFGDTWRWDGDVWSQVSEAGPSPRAFHGLAASPTERLTLLFGGWQGSPTRRTHFADSWAWNGASWERLEGESPPAGGVYAMTRDATGRSVLFHGGGRKAEGVAWHLENRTWLHREGRWMPVDSAS